MHQAPSKTPPYIQLLPRLARLTLPLEVTSSRKPTLLLLPDLMSSILFHVLRKQPAVPISDSSCHVHCPCLSRIGHPHQAICSLRQTHILLIPSLAHTWLCSVCLWVKRGKTCQAGEGNTRKAIQVLKTKRS